MRNSSIKCRECSYETIDLTVEDEQAFYLCENCGWGKEVYHPFRIGVWSVKIQQALAPIDVLHSLLTSKDIVTFLRPRLKGASYLSTSTLGFEMGDEYFRGEVEIANKVYLSQMIVLALTYAELIVKNFHRCLFFEQPKRMNHFLSTDEKKAKVYLNEILDAPSKEDLLSGLVERAANKASGRKIYEIVSALVKDCKLTLKDSIIQDLKLLNEKRNNIVHEGKVDEINIEQVLSGYGQLMHLLYILGEAAIHYNLPFIDEVGFLSDFREQLQSQ